MYLFLCESPRARVTERRDTHWWDIECWCGWRVWCLEWCGSWGDWKSLPARDEYFYLHRAE